MMPQSSLPCPSIALLVDDDPGLRAVLSTALSDAGFRVLALADPPSCDEVRRLAPDVLLLGVPAGNPAGGGAFARELKADPATAAVPVVAYRGKALRGGQGPVLFSVDALLAETVDQKSLDPLVATALSQESSSFV
jgi:CheY-like chemotaxis protein